nr:solute carrier family 17 member 2 [Myotis myotis]
MPRAGSGNARSDCGSCVGLSSPRSEPVAAKETQGRGASAPTCGAASRRSPMDEKPSARRGPDVCSLRYGLAVVMHLSNLSMITQRVSLSIAIIAMVNGTQQPAPANASADRPLQDPSGPIGEFHAGSSVYAWSPETQGILFSSISYGILLTLIPSGYLAGIFGAKHMLGAGLLASSLLSLCTPLAADLGVSLVMVIRVAQGMAQGMAWTGQFTIWAKWAPPLERSKLTSIAGSGAALGSSLILCVGGLISQALGWPFIFYIFGGLGCVCCLLWFTVIYDDPMGHPCISLREQEHIVSSLAQQPTSPRRSVPLKAMARCLPLWAIFSGFFSHFWLCTVIVTYLPTYVSSVLHVSIRESGVLSALPFVAASTCTVLGGQLADFLLSRDLLGLLTVRKLFSALGLLLPSLCAVALPFVASSYMTTVVLLILIPGTSNLCDSGFIINTLDIAPRYASFLMGISRGFGLLAGIISSTATGFLISQDSASGWRHVFFLAAAVNLFGLVFYLTFGRAELQDWAKERTLTRL